jgi:hypothetical protein
VSIIFSDDDDKAWCNDCDALLYERKDGSSVCSNGNCGRIYNADSIKKHHTQLGPTKESPYKNNGPEVVPLDSYADPERKKKPASPIDREDEKMFKRPGFSWISKEDY